MRLARIECEAIEAAARETLPAGSRVWLFGSRLDDSRRGGDIDLLLDLRQPLDADARCALRSRFVARIWRRIDERRIDVVLSEDAATDPRAIVQEVMARGTQLVAL